MYLVKAEVLRKICEDPEWSRRLEGCKTPEDVERLLVEFGKERGYKVQIVQ